MSSSVTIDLFFMFLPPFDSSQLDESNELKIVKNGSVVFDIAIIYFLLSSGYLDHFLTSSISAISTISALFRPYFDPEFSISVSCIDKTLSIENLHARVIGVKKYVLHFPAVCIRSNDS